MEEPVENRGPLKGIRVLDLTSVFLGPFAAQIMGDLGADVIKVEPVAGENTRFAHPRRSPDMGAVYMGLNRNKRSLAVDLKTEKGREAVLRLAATCDVFLCNMRHRAIKTLGLGYEDVKASSPGIVYCLAVGFAEDGPFAGKPAYDDIIQAASGFAAFQEMASGTPGYAATAVTDKITSLTVAYAVMAALLSRERSGEGQFVEVPMYESSVAFLAVEHLSGATFNPAMGETGYKRILDPNRRPQRAKDGLICILPYTDQHWSRFFEVAGNAALAKDDRFNSIASRSQNFAALYDWLYRVVAEKTVDEWVALLEPLQVPVMKVMDPNEWGSNPQALATGMIGQYTHPSEGSLNMVQPPVRYERTPSSIRRLAPHLGEHSAEILHELGYDAGEIAEMARLGTINTGEA